MGLHARYHRLLADTPINLAAGFTREEAWKAFGGMMSHLYDEPESASLRLGILEDEPVQDFIATHAGILNDAMADVDLSDKMRQSLEASNYIFSGLKTFHELNEARNLLYDDNGKIKPFERFSNDVQKVNDTYNKTYLQAEYNFVQASSEMAGRWEQFEADGDRYNLQYRTAGDDHVREEHAALDGITLPPSDPFWDVNFPPNGWNCRCTVVQVLKSQYPTTDRKTAEEAGRIAAESDKKGMFRFNPGKEGKSFPDYNPYTISKCATCPIANNKENLRRVSIPNDNMCAACKKMRSCWEKKQKEKGETFTECPVKSGKLRVSSEHGKTEKKENVRVATYLAEKYGYYIDLIANPPGVKSADSFNRTLGVFQEYKVNVKPTKSSIDGLIRTGAKQANHIVLCIDSDISLIELSDALNDRVARTSIVDVTIIIEGKDRTYSFDEITSNGFLIKQADLK